jgi:hypothetical protein
MRLIELKRMIMLKVTSLAILDKEFLSPIELRDSTTADNGRPYDNMRGCQVIQEPLTSKFVCNSDR